MGNRILSNRYSLEAEIGRGGMGVVYRARDLQLQRDVALKVLPAELARDEAFVERFNSEVLNTARLDHPHIVHIHDVGQDSDLRFYVMQHVDGKDLDQLMQRGEVDTAVAMRVLLQVAQALDYAHAMGVVHRDIKPENILVDSSGNAHVLDFGIARTIEGTRLTGGLIGTPAYMSAEQARGEKVDGRSDQYSLAIVGYRLFTGSTPFESEDTQPWALVGMDASSPPPDPRSRSDVADHVAQALLRALSKEPGERFPNCVAFVAQLSGSVESTLDPPGARRDTAHAQPSDAANQRRTRRPTVYWAGLPLIGVAALVGIGLIIWGRGSTSDRPKQLPQPARVSVAPQASESAPVPAPSSGVGAGTIQPQPKEAASVDLLTKEKVDQFVQTWVAVQNMRDVTAYSACYSDDFQGIKRTINGKAVTYNRRTWLADRRKMLTGTKGLRVVVESLDTAMGAGNRTARVQFMQYFTTSRYRDKGEKRLELQMVGDRILIRSEEMLWSAKL